MQISPENNMSSQTLSHILSLFVSLLIYLLYLLFLSFRVDPSALLVSLWS